MGLESISHRLLSYYQTKASEAGSASQQVGWKSDAAQRNRFEQICKVLQPASFSVNDFGCGLGDLLPYLNSNGFRDFDYRGYDMFPSMVEAARQRQGETEEARFLQIDNVQDMQRADFTLASGVFNIRFEITDSDWFSFILETLHCFDQRSKKGFAFNALTKYSDAEYMRPELYYSDPLTLFDYCKRHFSKNVALLHDYQEFDFTILVRK